MNPVLLSMRTWAHWLILVQESLWYKSGIIAYLLVGVVGFCVNLDPKRIFVVVSYVLGIPQILNCTIWAVVVCVGFSKSSLIVFNQFGHYSTISLCIGIFGWLLLSILYVLFRWMIIGFWLCWWGLLMMMVWLVNMGLCGRHECVELGK